MRKRMLVIVLFSMILLVGCLKQTLSDPLNSDKPITVTIWHYYNGVTMEAFDRLVSEFNETIGLERGIVVDAKSQGDVNQLATAIFDTANGAIGSAPMPEIFASYSDNAFRVHQIVPLVSLEQYFTEEELKSYRKEFLDEGKFITDNKYYIVPVAKSSENLYVNKTLWEPFAKEHGFTNSDLETWEGIYKVSKTYYEEMGKSFFGIDSYANYMMVVCMQLGNEFYIYNDDGTVDLNFNHENAKMIWDYAYKPYVNGYYLKSGRFSSDDAKTGSVLAYTGSTAGAAYFPVTVSYSEDEMVDIEPLVLPYPHFENKQAVAIQQGAGMCVTKSDKAHEYASMLFLKWLTNKKQNLKFALSTGYFPVENDALKEVDMLEMIERRVEIKAIGESIKASNIMFNEYTLYNSKPFLGSFEMRYFLDTNLINKINNDLEILNERVSNGGNREALISELCSEEAFEQWYSNFIDEANMILKKITRKYDEKIKIPFIFNSIQTSNYYFRHYNITNTSI